MLKSSKEVLNLWLQAVNRGNVDSLLGLYNRDAVLIPTFSNRVHDTPEKLREYFKKLGSREELSVALHERTLTTQHLKDDVYALSGIYNWRFSIEGELLNFEARFSYVLDLSRPAPILHHHSSQIPRTL